MPPFPVNILKRRTMVVIKSAALLFGDITKPCLTYINVCNTIYIIHLMHARTHAREGELDLGEDCLEDAAENEDCNHEEDHDGGDLRERGHDGLFDVDKDGESIADMYQGLWVEG
jgi:hypothetical protein